MRPLREEFRVPLDKVERAWLRRGVLVLVFFLVVFPSFIIAMVIAGVGKAISDALDYCIDFIKECW